jgi:UDP-N-acetylglucosamine--N-acetylmuramyl-(pentapeptide) pyrophosphoryl-undecaprenol N-acetylglucosamine transferase
MNVAIAAGGTAGHVNPAIALAHALKGEEITFVGTAEGAEHSLVPAAGFRLETIDVRGFDRARPWKLPLLAARALGATLRARRLLRATSAEVCVGMGGYVSLPVCLAARWLGTPVVIHEQNIVLGLANRLEKSFAEAVAVSFEETLEAAGEAGVLVGNPVLPEIAVVDLVSERERGWTRFDLDPTRKTLLVFGGSQGAQRVNEAAAGLASLWRDEADVQVLHITGKAGVEQYGRRVEESHAGGRLIYRLHGLVERMIEPYAVADLVLCRGGATTVAELCTVGLPSIIVPYPHHRDRQQYRHAQVLQEAGAASVLDDRDATSERVAEEVKRLVFDEYALEHMGKAAMCLGRPDAAVRLAELVREQVA